MKGKLVGRNVYTRMERIKMLKEEGKWNPAMSVFGIPKVKAVKSKRRKIREKAAKAEAAAATEAAPGAASAQKEETVTRQLQRVGKVRNNDCPKDV